MEESKLQKLRELKKEELLKLIVDYYDASEDFHHFIENSLIQEIDNYERLLTIIKEIDSENKYSINNTLENYFKDIELLITSPQKAISLIFQFYYSEEKISDILNQTATWHDIDFMNYSMEAETLFIKFAQKCDDKEYLIKKIRELIYLDGSDVGYTFVSCIKKMLNKEQIRKLISLLTEKLPNQEYVNYSIIADIAKELPDGDLYEKTSKKARNLTVSYLDIAKVYYEEGKYDKALEKVNLYKADYSFQELNKIQLLNKIYDKQNKKEEQIKTAKTLYEAHPTIKTLDLLLKASKIESREELINKTIETFYKERNTEYYEDNIKFLLTLDRVDEAETYFFMNIEKIEQLREYYSNDIIDKFEKNKKYLVVTLLYRDLLIKILDNAKYKAYEAGAEYLIQLDILSDKVNNWKHFITHEEFLSAIKIKHSRKKSFWNRYTENKG